MQMHISKRVIIFLWIVSVLVITSAIGVIYYGYGEYESSSEAVRSLTEANATLTSYTADLEEQVQELNDTINQQALDEAAEIQEAIDLSIPTGFPLNGAATIAEDTVDATIFQVGEGVSVIASGAGEVTYVGEDEEYGYCIEVTHEEGYVSIYRASADAAVSVGAYVNRGAILYTMEESMIMVYQIKENGAYVNPLEIMEIAG